MFEREQSTATILAVPLNEAGKLRDELGYQRSLQNQCGYSLLSMRVKAYLEFGIDLRSNEESVFVQS
jgi:hypothetical protein